MNDDRDWFSWEGIQRIRDDCDARARADGLSGLELYFRKVQLFDQALAEKPAYKERQRRWMKRQNERQSKLPHPFHDALQKIADGHNDAMGLAKRVLAQHGVLK